MTEVLIVPYGSAGDVFPFVPVASELRRAGVSTKIVVPRSSVRALAGVDLEVGSYGMGQEVSVGRDPSELTTSYSGWRSWRRVLTGPILRDMATSVEDISSHIQTCQPTLVVAGHLAVAARVAATLCGVKVVNVAMCPQWTSPRQSLRFASPLYSFLRDSYRLSEEQASQAILPRAEINLFDPLFGGSPSPVGYSYWDGADLDIHNVVLEQFASWLLSREGDHLVVLTAGSFLGLRGERTRFFYEIAESLEDLPLCFLLAGSNPLGPGQDPFGLEGRSMATRFVPLMAVAERATFLVHHAGMGVSSFVLATGIPSAAWPMSFDQSSNARSLREYGFGEVCRSPSQVVHSIREAFGNMSSDAPAMERKGRVQRYAAAASARARDLILADLGRVRNESSIFDTR